MLREVLPELSTIYTAFILPRNVSLNVTSLWTWPACYWYGSQTVAHPSTRVYQGERRILGTQT